MAILPVEVHLNGMINDKISRANWINLFWVTTEGFDCVTHGSKVHHSRDTTIARYKKTQKYF